MALKIFVASDKFPRPDTASGCRRFFSILEHLSRGHEVTLLVNRPRNLDDPEVKPFVSQLRKAGIKRMVTDFYNVGRLMATNRFDLGFIEFYSCDPDVQKAFRQSQPDAPMIIDSVDIHYLRAATKIKVGDGDAADVEQQKQVELDVYRHSDGVIVVSEEDEAGLKQEIENLKCWFVPNVVPILERSDQQRAKELLFIGGFKHTPNVDGILWFANEIWPRIADSCHDAVLTIVGSYPPENVKELGSRPGIDVVGYVPETAPYLDRAAVSIAPLRVGAGMKGKVTEALAAGIPVVTTTIGAQGFDAVSGTHMFIEDEPPRFADRVIELLEDPLGAAKIGATGRDLVSRICSPEAVCAKLDRMLDEVVQNKRTNGYFGQRTIYQMNVLGSLCSKIPRKLASLIAGN